MKDSTVLILLGLAGAGIYLWANRTAAAPSPSVATPNSTTTPAANRANTALAAVAGSDAYLIQRPLA